MIGISCRFCNTISKGYLFRVKSNPEKVERKGQTRDILEDTYLFK